MMGSCAAHRARRDLLLLLLLLSVLTGLRSSTHRELFAALTQSPLDAVTGSPTSEAALNNQTATLMSLLLCTPMVTEPS